MATNSASASQCRGCRAVVLADAVESTLSENHKNLSLMCWAGNSLATPYAAAKSPDVGALDPIHPKEGGCPPSHEVNRVFRWSFPVLGKFATFILVDARTG